jgi:hypothetical protein
MPTTHAETINADLLAFIETSSPCRRSPSRPVPSRPVPSEVVIVPIGSGPASQECHVVVPTFEGSGALNLAAWVAERHGAAPGGRVSLNR